MATHKPKYKPLLFTTTIRNPERIKFFLYIIAKYKGKILTNDLATEIVGEAIRYGLYRPIKKRMKSINEKWRLTSNGEFANQLLNDKELNFMLVNNSQKHKEKGFAKGWPSRFDTEFKFAKQLGLVYYESEQEIIVSDLGKKLLDCFSVSVDDDGTLSYSETKPENEQLVFIQAMGRYQRNNPFLKVLNANVPLLLLLQVISKLNSNPHFNDANGNTKGISRKELPLLIFWKNSGADALYERIVQLRKDYGYNPSNEVIEDICLNEIMEGNFKKFKPKSIMQEYPDEFIRKMRITGLISLRGAGRFIDINTLESDKVDYVLKTYSNYHTYTDPKEYFDYVSALDTNLFGMKAPKISAGKAGELLPQWLNTYNWKQISKELRVLSRKGNSKDEVLRIIPAPARLEFLTALSIKCKLPQVQVVPNYACDDTGLPTSTAGGNHGDIECFEQNSGILVEVTMAEGRTQTMMEIWPISRHLDTFAKDYNLDSQCVFIAPTIFSDSLKQIGYLKATENQDIRSYTIEDFIKFLQNASRLYVS